MLSVGEFIDNFDPDPDPESVGQALSNYLTATNRANWDVYGDGGVPDTADFPDWFSTLKAVAGRQRNDATDVLRSLFAADTSEAKGSDSDIPGIGE
jgi:hypothetical protein